MGITTRGSKIGMSIDLRKLNAVTVKDSYSLPRVDNILGSLCGAQYFTALDLFFGYYQIQMEEQSKETSTTAVDPHNLKVKV